MCPPRLRLMMLNLRWKHPRSMGLCQLRLHRPVMHQLSLSLSLSQLRLSRRNLRCPNLSCLNLL